MLFIFSCSKSSKEINVNIEKLNINNSKLIEVDKQSCNDCKRFVSQFNDLKGNVFIAGLINDSISYLIDVNNDSLSYHNLPFKVNLSEDLMNFKENEITLLKDNNLFNYNFNENKLDTISKDIKTENEFFKRGLYSSGISIYNNEFFVNYGNANDNFFIDDYALYGVKNGNKNKFIKYPKEIRYKYIHYNDLKFMIDNDSSFYFTLNSYKSLFHYDKNGKLLNQISLPEPELYPDFDTLKIRNIGYVTNYSYNIKYNLRVFKIKDYIAVLTYSPKPNNTPTNNDWDYALNLYDNDLEFVKSIPLEFEIINNLVSNTADTVYFTYPPTKEINKIIIE